MRFYNLLQWPTGGMLQPTHIDNCGITRQFIFMSNFQSNPQPCSHTYSAAVCHRRKAQLEAKDYTDLLIFGKKILTAESKLSNREGEKEWTWQQSELCKDGSRGQWTQWKDFCWFLKILDISQGNRNTVLYLSPSVLHLNGKYILVHN